MKKLMTAAALMAASSLSFAANTGPGCGAGSIIFDGQNGIGPHVLAATTNGTFGNQTFGMTFGTLGCDTNQTIESMAMYMHNNIDKIARDVSRGNGENLDALAIILGVDSADREHFAAVLQSNFNTIFPSQDVTAGVATQEIYKLMKADTTLSQYAS